MSCLSLTASVEHITHTTEHLNTEFNASPREGVVPTHRCAWVLTSQDYAVVLCHLVVTVGIVRTNVTSLEMITVGIPLSHLGCIAFLPEAIISITIEYGQRLTDEQGVVRHVVLTISQFYNLVFLVSNIEYGLPLEVLGLNWNSVQSEFNTMVLALTHVGSCAWETSQRWNCHTHNQVVGT